MSHTTPTTDYSALLNAMTDLAEVFPEAKLSERAIVLYIEDLADYPTPVVVAALEHLRRTSKFMPKIAEIREVIALAILGPTTKASEQAKHVLKQIMHVGTYQDKPTFDDPITDKVVSELGWKNLGLMSPNEVREAVMVGYQTNRKAAMQKLQSGQAKTKYDAIMKEANAATLFDALPEGEKR